MHQRGKNLTALVLALCIVLSLTACGGGGESDPLAAALENMEKLESMDAKVIMEMDMDVAGQTVETVMTVDASVFNAPMRIKENLTMDMGGYGDTSVEMYAETAEDGSITMYQYDGMDWSSQSVTMDEMSQYDVGSNMDLYMTSTTGLKPEGTEEVDGISAYKYTGVVTGEAIQEVMLSSGALDSMSTQMNMDEAQMKDMLSGLGDIAVTMWIDEESLYPVRCDMDMTAIMDGLIDKILETAGGEEVGITMSISKMTMSTTCFNFNSATDFTIPQEAKNA